MCIQQLQSMPSPFAWLPQGQPGAIGAAALDGDTVALLPDGLLHLLQGYTSALSWAQAARQGSAISTVCNIDSATALLQAQSSRASTAAEALVARAAEGNVS